MVVIFYCQVVVYCETRRHEKHIASQQVSAEARRKFLKAKKAFKVTTAVLLTLIMTYLPIFFVRILIKNSVVVTPVFFTATYIVMLNSLANPVIYCVRTRQFRVAFIEIILRKTNARAEEFEMQVFGLKNNSENKNNKNADNESNPSNKTKNKNNGENNIQSDHHQDNNNNSNRNYTDENTDDNDIIITGNNSEKNSNWSDSNSDENNMIATSSTLTKPETTTTTTTTKTAAPQGKQRKYRRQQEQKANTTTVETQAANTDKEADNDSSIDHNLATTDNNNSNE